MYFNSGVMLINLAKWKKDKVSLQILDFIGNSFEYKCMESFMVQNSRRKTYSQWLSQY